MKYPQVSCELDKRIKICNKDMKKIIKLAKKGKSITDISKIYKVSFTTIKRIIDPKYEKHYYELMKKYIKKRYAEDGEFRDKLKKQVTKNIKKRSAEDEKFRRWRLDYILEYQKIPKNRDRRNLLRREAYAKKKISGDGDKR